MDGVERSGIEVLLIEDNLGDARLLREMLRWAPRELGIRLHHCDSLQAFSRLIETVLPDVVLVDLGVPESQGLDTLRHVVSRLRDVPIIVLTGLDDEQTAIEAMQEGAEDYLTKYGLDSRILIRSIRYAMERHDLKAQAEFLATHDPLTGVYNRHHFNETIEAEVARAARYAHPIGVLMLDVNGFKEINDRHGHLVGDQVLRCVAEKLGEQLRTVDIVIRYGGDEFLVVLPETEEGVWDVRDRLGLMRIDCGTDDAPLDFDVTLSIGASVWKPDAGRTMDDVIGEADRRMYEQKRALYEKGIE